MTLFEAPTGGAFDRLNWQSSGELDQNFSKKSNAPGFARWGGGWVVLELTGRQGRYFEMQATYLSEILPGQLPRLFLKFYEYEMLIEKELCL